MDVTFNFDCEYLEMSTDNIIWCNRMKCSPFNSLSIGVYLSSFGTFSDFLRVFKRDTVKSEIALKTPIELSIGRGQTFATVCCFPLSLIETRGHFRWDRRGSKRGKTQFNGFHCVTDVILRSQPSSLFRDHLLLSSPFRLAASGRSLEPDGTCQ